ncbi:hypothetical protein PCE1_004594 [Barthelona sp. PCE]
MNVTLINITASVLEVDVLHSEPIVNIENCSISSLLLSPYCHVHVYGSNYISTFFTNSRSYFRGKDHASSLFFEQLKTNNMTVITGFLRLEIQYTEAFSRYFRIMNTKHASFGTLLLSDSFFADTVVDKLDKIVCIGSSVSVTFKYLAVESLNVSNCQISINTQKTDIQNFIVVNSKVKTYGGSIAIHSLEMTNSSYISQHISMEIHMLTVYSFREGFKNFADPSSYLISTEIPSVYYEEDSHTAFIGHIINMVDDVSEKQLFLSCVTLCVINSPTSSSHISDTWTVLAASEGARILYMEEASFIACSSISVDHFFAFSSVNVLNCSNLEGQRHVINPVRSTPSFGITELSFGDVIFYLILQTVTEPWEYIAESSATVIITPDTEVEVVFFEEPSAPVIFFVLKDAVLNFSFLDESFNIDDFEGKGHIMLVGSSFSTILIQESPYDSYPLRLFTSGSLVSEYHIYQWVDIWSFSSIVFYGELKLKIHDILHISTFIGYLTFNVSTFEHISAFKSPINVFDLGYSTLYIPFLSVNISVIKFLGPTSVSFGNLQNINPFAIDASGLTIIDSNFTICPMLISQSVEFRGSNNISSSEICSFFEIPLLSIRGELVIQSTKSWYFRNVIVYPDGILNIVCMSCSSSPLLARSHFINYGTLIFENFYNTISDTYFAFFIKLIDNFNNIQFKKSNIDVSDTSIRCANVYPRPTMEFSSYNSSLSVVSSNTNPWRMNGSLCSRCNLNFYYTRESIPIDEIDSECMPTHGELSFGELNTPKNLFRDAYPKNLKISLSETFYIQPIPSNSLAVQAGKCSGDFTAIGFSKMNCMHENASICLSMGSFFEGLDSLNLTLTGSGFVSMNRVGTIKIDANAIFLSSGLLTANQSDWQGAIYIHTSSSRGIANYAGPTESLRVVILNAFQIYDVYSYIDESYIILGSIVSVGIKSETPISIVFNGSDIRSFLDVTNHHNNDLVLRIDQSNQPIKMTLPSGCEMHISESCTVIATISETILNKPFVFHLDRNSTIVLAGNTANVSFVSKTSRDELLRPQSWFFVNNITLNNDDDAVTVNIFGMHMLQELYYSEASTIEGASDSLTVAVSGSDLTTVYCIDVECSITILTTKLAIYAFNSSNVLLFATDNPTVMLVSHCSLVNSSHITLSGVSSSTDIVMDTGYIKDFIAKNSNLSTLEINCANVQIFSGSFTVSSWISGDISFYNVMPILPKLINATKISVFSNEEFIFNADDSVYVIVLCDHCVTSDFNTNMLEIYAYSSVKLTNVRNAAIGWMSPDVSFDFLNSNIKIVQYFNEIANIPNEIAAGQVIACLEHAKGFYHTSIFVSCSDQPITITENVFGTIINLKSPKIISEKSLYALYMLKPGSIFSGPSSANLNISPEDITPFGLLIQCSEIIEGVECNGFDLNSTAISYHVCDMFGCTRVYPYFISHESMKVKFTSLFAQNITIEARKGVFPISISSLTRTFKSIKVNLHSSEIDVTLPFLHNSDERFMPVALERMEYAYKIDCWFLLHNSIRCSHSKFIGNSTFNLLMDSSFVGSTVSIMLTTDPPTDVSVNFGDQDLVISGKFLYDDFFHYPLYIDNQLYESALIDGNITVPLAEIMWCPGVGKVVELRFEDLVLFVQTVVMQPHQHSMTVSGREIDVDSQLRFECLDISHNGLLDEDSLIVSTTDNLVFKIYFEQAVPGLELTVLGETASEFVPDPTVSSVDRVTAATDNMVLRLSGSGLGGNAVMRHLSVRFGSYDCTISDASETEILCSIEGIGADLQLELTIGTYTESLSQRVSFDPPILKSIVPPLAGCVSDTVAVIRGMNFGIGSVEVTISLPDGSTTTSSLVSASHSLLSVTIPGDPTGECSGFAAVSIRTGGQTSNPLIVAYAVVGSVAPAIVPASETATMLTLDVSNAYAEPVLVLVDDDVSIEITCTYTSYRVTCNTVLNEPRTYTPFLCDGTTELDECEEPSGSVTVFGVEQDRLLTAGSNSEARARFTLVNVDFDFDLRNIDWISTPVVSSLLIEGSVADPYSAVFDYGAGQLPLEPQLLSVGIILQDELVVSGDRFVVNSDYPLDQVSVTLNGTNIYCTSRVVDSTTLHDCVANVDPGDYVVRYTSTEITTSVGLLSVYTVTSIEPQTVFSDKPFEVIITGYNLPEVDDPFCQWTVSHISCISTGISDAQTVVFDWISTPITVDPFPVLDLPAFAYVNTSYDISCSENCDFLVNNTVFTTTTGDKPLVACNNAHCAVFSSITISEPVITSISPLTVSVTSIRPITVAGHSFKPSCVCDIGGERETTVVDDSTIICDVPTDVNVSPVLSPYCLAGIPTSLGPIFNAQSVASVRESRCMLQPSDPVKKSSFEFDGATDTVVDGVLVSYFDTCNVPSVNISIGDVSLIVNSDATCDRLPSFATTHKVCAYKVDMFVVSPGMIIDVSVIDGCDATSINSIDLVELQLLQPVSVAITLPTTVRANPGDVSISVSLANIFGAQVTHEYFVDYCKRSYSGMLPVFVLPLCRTSSEALMVTAFDSISNVTLKASTVIEPTLGDVFDLSFSSVDVEVWSREAEHVLQFNATDWLGRNVDTSFSTSGSCNGTVLAVSAASIRFNASYEQIRNCSLCASKFCVPLVVNELEYVHRSFDLTVFGVVGPGTIYIEPKNIPPHVRVSELNSTIAHISVIAQNIEVDSIEFMLNMSAQSIPYAISDLAPGSILTFSLLSSNETVAFANTTIECPTSTVWSSTTRTCVCDRGTFISSTDPLSCAPCGEGFYQPDIHSAVCLECAATFVSEEGSVSVADCHCTLGTYLEENMCTNCPRGYLCRDGKLKGIEAGYFFADIPIPCVDNTSCLEIETFNESLCNSGRSGYLCHNCDSTRVSRYSECDPVKIGPNAVAGVILLVWCIVCAFIPGVRSIFVLSRVSLSIAALFNILSSINRWYTVALGDFEIDSFIVGDFVTVVLLFLIVYLVFIRININRHTKRVRLCAFPIIYHLLWSMAMSFPALSTSQTLQLSSHNFFMTISVLTCSLSFLAYKKQYCYLSTLVFIFFSSATIFSLSLRYFIGLQLFVTIVTINLLFEVL